MIFSIEVFDSLRFFAAIFIFILHATNHNLLPATITQYFDLSKSVSFSLYCLASFLVMRIIAEHILCFPFIVLDSLEYGQLPHFQFYLYYLFFLVAFISQKRNLKITLDQYYSYQFYAYNPGFQSPRFSFHSMQLHGVFQSRLSFMPVSLF